MRSWFAYFWSTTSPTSVVMLSGIIERSCDSAGRSMSEHKKTSIILCFKNWMPCGMLRLFEDPTIHPEGAGLKWGLSSHPLTSILRRDLPCRRATWWTSRSSWSSVESPWTSHLFLDLLRVIPKTWAHFFWLRLTVVWCCWKSAPTFAPDWSQSNPSRLWSKSKLTTWWTKGQP